MFSKFVNQGVICCSAYDYIIPARGKIVANTDIQIALPDGCYGRVGKQQSHYFWGYVSA